MVLGLVTVWPVLEVLRSIWTRDDLKSIGALFPIVSFLLILRAWRELNWRVEGNWWGLAILASTVFVVHLREQAVILFVVSPQWAFMFPPPALVIFAYGLGFVLLFGGTKLVRACIFPLTLLLFVDPVPNIFNSFVDLPLQWTAAHVARAFAMAMGQTLTPDQLRLMFTPQFGMFIAPGCNGMRGAMTMGFITLIAGYLYRFRWYVHAGFVVAAVFLGYVFNFLRLILLVVYYLIALHIRWLQPHAKMGDYMIGGTLFLLATSALFWAVSRFAESRREQTEETVSTVSALPVQRSFYLRAGAVLVLVIFGLCSAARAYIHESAIAHRVLPTQGQFPARVGRFVLSRTWSERLQDGTLVYYWAQYRANDQNAISVGIGPNLGAHDILVCHTARGEDPLWRSQLTLPTATGIPVNFSGVLFNNGVTQLLDASTICNGSTCGEYASPYTHFGFIYSKPAVSAFLARGEQRPIPVLMKIETSDLNLSADVASLKLSNTLRDFVSSADIDGLTQPYRTE